MKSKWDTQSHVIEVVTCASGLIVADGMFIGLLGEASPVHSFGEQESETLLQPQVQTTWWLAMQSDQSPGRRMRCSGAQLRRCQTSYPGCHCRYIAQSRPALECRRDWSTSRRSQPPGQPRQSTRSVAAGTSLDWQSAGRSGSSQGRRCQRLNPAHRWLRTAQGQILGLPQLGALEITTKSKPCLDCSTQTEICRLETRSLLREPNSVQKVLETRVGPQRIKGGPLEDAWVKPCFIAFLKP